jgi:hypothetical protein
MRVYHVQAGKVNTQAQAIRKGVDTPVPLCYTPAHQLHSNQTVNRKSTHPGAAQRAGGWCKTGADAGAEWAWESRSERRVCCPLGRAAGK